MLTERRLRALLPTLLVAVLAGCGGETSGGEGGGEAGTSRSCDNVPVPGHEATNVRVQALSCSRAAEVAAAALGKGRKPYEADGFACEPSDAGGGDTIYVCTRDDARVTFRYGTA